MTAITIGSNSVLGEPEAGARTADVCRDEKTGLLIRKAKSERRLCYCMSFCPARRWSCCFSWLWPSASYSDTAFARSFRAAVARQLEIVFGTTSPPTPCLILSGRLGRNDGVLQRTSK